MLRNWIKRHLFVTQTIATSIVAYSLGVIVNLVTQDPKGNVHFLLLLVGGLVACVMLTIMAALVQSVAEADRNRLQREINAHRSGYQTLNREISEYIKLLRSLAPDLAGISTAPVDLMRNACRDLYETLEGEYGHSVRVSEHVEFEVTFMTKSIDDGELTVAAWANRDARAPKSLAKRKYDSKVYAGTESDKVYQDENRSPRFVKSTTSPDYKEIYPGQKNRIKSSVIYPVVDDQFTLQGTLVVHCDSENFFGKELEKFWREMLEPYTKRLALARIAADKIKEKGLPVTF